MPNGKASVRITKNRFSDATAGGRAAAGRAVRMIALDLLGQAVNEAPVKEGILRGSGSAHFDGQRISTGAEHSDTAVVANDENAAVAGGAGSDSTTAILAFNAVYAEAQHERTDYAHPKGGKAKYLEDPLERNRKQYQERIRAEIRKELS